MRNIDWHHTLFMALATIVFVALVAIVVRSLDGHDELLMLV